MRRGGSQPKRSGSGLSGFFVETLGLAGLVWTVMVFSLSLWLLCERARKVRGFVLCFAIIYFRSSATEEVWANAAP